MNGGNTIRYFNKITEELDQHMLYTNQPYCYDTYITEWKDDEPFIWLIRVVGATRGCIRTDENNIIKEIKLYDDTCFKKGIGCYKQSAKSILDKYIGQKLTFYRLDV